MTIYALSSGPGVSGVAVIRVTGENTSEVIKERNKELVKSMSEIKTFPKEFL